MGHCHPVLYSNTSNVHVHNEMYFVDGSGSSHRLHAIGNYIRNLITSIYEVYKETVKWSHVAVIYSPWRIASLCSYPPITIYVQALCMYPEPFVKLISIPKKPYIKEWDDNYFLIAITQ